jgi:putative RecB family exonuclease
MVDPAEAPERHGTPVDGVHVVGALSPSRANDFRTCALKYRLRAVDRLPERPSVDALRGTVVHKVLEDLFDVPAPERTPERAADMVDAAWRLVVQAEPEAGELLDGPDVEPWLESCRTVLARYFDLEDPTRLEPAEREQYVETLLESRLLLRGVIDRVDRAPDGALRVVDYKTSSSVSEGFEFKALFQLRIYALILWRSRGVVPRMLQLVYLGTTSEMVRYEPDEADLRATERKVEAIWEAISEAKETGVFEPSPGRQCDWCAFKVHCPAWGGELLPMPVPPSRWVRLRRAVRRRWRRVRRRLSRR